MSGFAGRGRRLVGGFGGGAFPVVATSVPLGWSRCCARLGGGWCFSIPGSTDGVVVARVVRVLKSHTANHVMKARGVREDVSDQGCHNSIVRSRKGEIRYSGTRKSR